MTPLRRVLFYNSLVLKVRAVLFRRQAGPALVRAFAAAGIISFQDDPKKCKVARAEVLWEEARRRNIRMRELLLFSRPIDMYLLPAKVKKKLFFPDCRDRKITTARCWIY